MRNVSFLLVDDCHSVVSIVKKSIKNRLGSEKIFEATDGAKAIKILESKEVDMIISDWEMPNVSGEELLYHVRNNAKLKEYPFYNDDGPGRERFHHNSYSEWSEQLHSKTIYSGKTGRRNPEIMEQRKETVVNPPCQPSKTSAYRQN